MVLLSSFSDTITRTLQEIVTSSKLIALFTGVTVIWITRRVINKIRVKSLIRNIPGPKNGSWLTGSFPEVYDVLNIKWHHETTRKYGGIVQIDGMFGDEQLYITDPRALYHIIVKEQSIFEEPQSLLVMNGVLMGNGLLATLGDYHKQQRKILNPIFSIKNMRALVPIFHRVTQKLCSVLESKLNSGDSEQEINVFEWSSRTALEFIAQGGLGASLDSMKEGETSTYTKLAKQLVPTVSRLHVPMQLLPAVKPIFKALPETIRSVLLSYSPFPAVRKLKEITEELEDVSKDILERKKSEIMNENGMLDDKSRDILSVLLRANMQASVNDKLPDDEVIAHITTLIFTAQDTTASAISRTLYILSQNVAAQDRVREEIRIARSTKAYEEEWDYDELMRLPFLDAVCRETLRLHNPVSWIWRVARKQTVLPLLRPVCGTDGEILTSIPVAKNQGLVIGIAASNRDEAVWGPDAWEWKPERWLEPGAMNLKAEELGLTGGDEWKAELLDSENLKEARYPGVYSGMMTFSGGGRSCIGFKFALLSLKLAIATLLERFAFQTAEEVVWNMNHIAAPTLKSQVKGPSKLPLKVALAP